MTSDFTSSEIIPHTIMPWTGEHAIRITNLHFSHGNSSNTLFSDMNMRVPNGTTTCILGPSGAGKTTLFRMLTGSHNDYTGKIEVFDQDISDMTCNGCARTSSWCRSQALRQHRALQHHVRRPHVTEAQVEQLMRDLELPAIFQNLSNGLHTPVGAEGKFLSGGQRQATMLLRALFSVAPIILLDEPTSNLDPTSKKILMRAIKRAG